MNPIVIVALLVQAEPDRLRLLLGPRCLDFLLSDVVEVEELPAPAGLIAGSAIPARVTLQPGARLMRLALSHAYDSLIWDRPLPFAFATRTLDIVVDHEPMMKTERAFFAARGLLEQLS